MAGTSSTFWTKLQNEILQCRDCPRLTDYLADIRNKYPDYWCQPVPAFGNADARIMLLGLAPGRFGSNRTGRMFTGDASGDFMFPLLHQAGLCNQAESTGYKDGLILNRIVITAAGRCAPPQNKPTRKELETCSKWLRQEFSQLQDLRVVFALGKIGHDAYLRFLGKPLSHYPFGHATVHEIPGHPTMVDTYHPSRQNTNTGKLTAAMFLNALSIAKQCADI